MDGVGGSTAPSTGPPTGPPGPGRPRSRGLLGLLGAALALVLVFVAVRVTSTAPGPAAAPASEQLFDVPPRGPLAGDTGWLHAVAALGALAALPADRHVVFARDVAGERVALVLGRDGGRTVAAWLAGPAGADPARMALAAGPGPVGPDQPLALWDVPVPVPTGGLLLVVARPGDELDFLPGRSVDAHGDERESRYALPVTDGVSMVAIGPPVAARTGGLSSGAIEARRDGVRVRAVPELSAPARRVADAPVDPADPRGLRASVDERQLQALLHEMLGAYGLPAPQLTPVLLTAGPVRGTGARAILAGATLPSGATVAWLSVDVDGPGRTLHRTVRTVPAAAGPALLDRVIAVPAGWALSQLPLPPGAQPPGWLAISGPRAATAAEAASADGRTLAGLPLVQGAGIPAVPPGTAAVRVLASSGARLGDAPVAELAG